MQTFILYLLIFAFSAVPCFAQTVVAAGKSPTGMKDQAMTTAHRWLNAKFLGGNDTKPASAEMLVTLKSGNIQKNLRRDRTMLIVNTKYQRGIVMPSPGEIKIKLPEPAASFEAIVGVDSSDLGYYGNAGRGMVIASVAAGGKELFKSGTLSEGIPGVPVKANLAGATEFSIKLDATGERTRTYQAEWDQSDWCNAKITLASGKVLWLDEIPVGPLPGAYTQEPPFSFIYDGKPSSSFLKNWTLTRSTRKIDNHRTEYVSTYADPDTKLEIRAVAVAYDDFPAVEWTMYFKNGGDKPTPIIENIQALDTAFERTMDKEFLLHHSKGSTCSPTDFEPLETVLAPKSEENYASIGGRPTDGNLCYFNLEWANTGVIMAIGWPGQWAAKFTRDDNTGVRVTAGQELTHFKLLPGEEVRSPLIALLFWNGDWTGSQNEWRRWMITHNMPRPGGKLPPPHIAGGSNRQTIEMQDATEENQLRFLKRDLDKGVKLDYWWMDAGWYTFNKGWWETGTWDPDPARFPNGFTPISAAAAARGTKTLVWFEPERVAPGTWLDKNHPDWLLGKDGENKLLYLGNPEAWNWLLEHVSGMIKNQGIGLYRQDFNFEPLLLWRGNDSEDRQGITEIKHVTGYLAYWDELRRRFPNMLIDTCASGGRRDDLETLRRSVPLWRSDYAFEPSSMQQFTYGMALWIPYFGTGFNSLDPYIFRSQMTPALGIGISFSSYENGYARAKILTDQWRSMADYYYGDYYPLTPYYTTNTEWMAWQFDRPEKGDGIVQAFRRPDSSIECSRYILRGLDEKAQYSITDMDVKGVKTFSGKELMEKGLPVNIKNKPGAVIITYKKAATVQKVE